MTRRFIAVVFALSLSATVARNLPAAVNVGDSPELSFKSVDGQDIKIADLKGRIVLVDFWATWCGPCMAEAEHMVEINQKYADQGLQIIGISLDQNRQSLENIVKEKGFVWPQFFDGKGWQNKISSAWGVDSIPRTFLLDTAGKVVWTGHPAQMDQAIDTAFKTTPPVLVDPKIEQSALAMLEQVQAALTGGDSAGAMKSMAAIPDEARKSATVKQRVGEVESKLDEYAQAELGKAEGLIGEKKYLEAAEALSLLGRGMGKSPQGIKAMQRLSELKQMPEARDAMKLAESSAKADTELAAADALRESGKDEGAYARYKLIVKQFPGTAGAASAAEQVATYEKDPAFVKRANEAAAGSKARGMISLAQSYLRAGHKDKARAKYQEVVDQFPGTSFAETAKTELAAIK